jgi:hypothetical protein
MTDRGFWTFLVIVVVGLMLTAAYLAAWVRNLRRSRVIDNARLMIQRELDGIRDERPADRRGLQYPRSWQPFMSTRKTYAIHHAVHPDAAIR